MSNFQRIASSGFVLPATLVLMVSLSSCFAERPKSQASEVPPNRADVKSQLVQAADQGNQAEVELLISQYHLSPDTRDSSGNTLLILTARKKRDMTAAALLKMGAKPNLKNSEGRSALDFAQENGDFQLISLLESHHEKRNK